MGLGYRNVACLGAAGASSSEELAREIASAATEAGMLCSYFNIYMHPGFYENLAAEQDPEFCTWVENLPMATAVVTTGGYTALLLEQTAAAVGRNVPAELAVLSISDDEVCLFADPPISSFYSAGKDIGRKALTIINDTLNGAKHPCGKQLLPPPAIIERRSTGFPAGMDEGAKRALRFIKEHACEGISVDDVVRHVRIMGRTRLYNQIKRYLGRSPAAEIMRLRIARAQQLLATTNLPVTRIVDACGFNSHAQFSVTFRRETGLTATAFRKKNSG
jgi:LacI family transcriptional regulator